MKKTETTTQPTKSPERDAMDRIVGIRETLSAQRSRRINVVEMLSRFTDVKSYGGKGDIFLARCPIHTIANGIPPKHEPDFTMLVLAKPSYVICWKCGHQGYADSLEEWLLEKINAMTIKYGAGQL